MLKKILKNSLIFISAAFFIVYFCIQVKNIFIDDLETEYATLATMEDTVELNAYIVRDESIIESDAVGTYNYQISEGERLAKNQVIANIYSSDTEFKAQEEIDRLDSKIRILNESSVEHNYFTLSVTKIDENIADILTEYRERIQMGDLALAAQKKSELLITLNKRYLVVNALKSFEDVAKRYEDEKEALGKQSSNVTGQVVAPTSGYFYSDVDGYENILTPDFIKTATAEQLIDAIDNGPDHFSHKVVGKMIPNFNWHTVCIVDKDTSLKFFSDRTYDIAYPYSIGTVVTSYLAGKTVQSDGDKAVLIFESNNSTNTFNFMRSQKIEVVLDTYSGLRIKKSALRIVDGWEGVYILDGNTVEFKRANKVYENDGYYIITVDDPLEEQIDQQTEEERKSNPIPPYIEMYDSVINNGKELYDGKIIG